MAAVIQLVLRKTAAALASAAIVMPFQSASTLSSRMGGSRVLARGEQQLRAGA